MVAGSHTRPADILLPTWQSGCPAALDIHVISPLQYRILYAAVSTPGQALNVGVQRKMEAHLSDCLAAGMDFVPVVVEALGGGGEGCLRMSSLLFRRLGRQSPNMLALTVPLLVLVSFFTASLWRGNACLLLHRHPTLPPPVDGIF